MAAITNPHNQHYHFYCRWCDQIYTFPAVVAAADGDYLSTFEPKQTSERDLLV